MKKTILTLDLGSITGFAIDSPEGFSSGTLNFKTKGKFSDRGYASLRKFMGFLNKDNLEIVVEKPHAGRFMAPVRILFGLLAVVKGYCYEENIPYFEYSPKEIKKFWTGKGNASKEEMVLTTKAKHSYVKDHNESDAIALLHLHITRSK